ncbi:MAG: DUF3793 family protein [Ruminococcus sp.]|nr:DUF3793 family protein [Ruminococcus sp.]
MSEDLIIKHCSPTLAGLKTANLFTCAYAHRQDVECFAREFNRRFSRKGVKMLPLDFGKSRALIYVFRPTRLQRDLSDAQAIAILKTMGYDSFDNRNCLNRLKSRVQGCPEFPHEIGLFLGYPPEDVRGFILHKGNCCKCCGCWKVYGNEEKAAREFAKYKKCTDIYYSKWLQGTSINKLVVKKSA